MNEKDFIVRAFPHTQRANVIEALNIMPKIPELRSTDPIKVLIDEDGKACDECEACGQGHGRKAQADLKKT